MSDSPGEPRAKRQKVDRHGRIAALAKLKELKGSKNKYNIENDVDNVYDEVDEREYAKRVLSRAEDDWIEDDGTGYVEDGREIFDDDEDGEFDSPSAKRSGKGEKKKKGRDTEAPVKGKGSIRNMFSNVIPKKKETVKLENDDILVDILGEISEIKPKPINISNGIHPASTSSKLSSRKKANDDNVAKQYLQSFSSNIKKPTVNAKKDGYTSDDELLERICKPTVKPTPKRTPQPIITMPVIEKNVVTPIAVENGLTMRDCKPNAPDIVKEIISNTKTLEIEESIPNEMFEPFESETPALDDDDFANMDFSIIDEAELQCPSSKPETQQLKQPQNKLEELSDKFFLTGWNNVCPSVDLNQSIDSRDVDESKMDLSEKTDMKFWYWDAWEDANIRPGEVCLFGRLPGAVDKTSNNPQSVCVHVKNIEKCLFLLPRERFWDSKTKQMTDKPVSLMDVYNEFNEKVAPELGVDTFLSRKAMKKYPFSAPNGVEIPEACEYLEVRYNGKFKSPNLHKKYETIAYVFGTNTSALETFLLERKIKGPCWLKLNNFTVNTVSSSWCKLEVTCPDPLAIEVSEDKTPPIPLTFMTLNIRTALNTNTLRNEIVMIGCLVNNKFVLDKPPQKELFQRHFCAFTRPTTQTWPTDIAAKLAAYTSTEAKKMESERALLSWFLATYQKIDADLIVTHDANDCQLEALCDRLTALKIPLWSRIGRLKMSNLTKNKLKDYFTGRMICDIKLSSEELIKSKSYDLDTLCKNVLKIDEGVRYDVSNDDLCMMYDSGEDVMKLMSLTMQDCLFTTRLMCELNVLPLALQITNVCGNLMGRTLQGGRSERNEYYLLHAFHEKNFIVPDKKSREYGGGNKEIDDTAAPRKKAAYAGGLVLDPIKGFYDSYILLMDFNSLYPSIIQEYNICFTTVIEPAEGDIAAVPEPGVEQGILPRQIRRLVESRREVKKLMANPDLENDLKMQYNIRQLALKLTANSMYGCLGFSFSRFYAQHLAALVTFKGREILMHTKSLVQKLNFEVVYGDTDSIMINTNVQDLEQVYRFGASIKQAVNKIYKQIELEIDGVFKRLLLLKKKKYAALIIEKNKKGEVSERTELKGLDIVRRDWSGIAVIAGNLVVNEILSDNSMESKIEKIRTDLEKIGKNLRDGVINYRLLSIKKLLTKQPSQYTNIASLAHVAVALRMNQTKNRRFKKGDVIDYVICDDNTTNAAMKRAYHIDEINGNPDLKIDVEYYLAHQVHAVVARLLEVIPEIDSQEIATALGLDPSKFKIHSSKQKHDSGEMEMGTSITNHDFNMCNKFSFFCALCDTENVVESAFRADEKGHHSIFLRCTNKECSAIPYHNLAGIRNAMVFAVRDAIVRFYENWMVCDNTHCSSNTRNYCHVMKNRRPVCLECSEGRLFRQYTAGELHNQLLFYQQMFDLSKHDEKLHINFPKELIAAYNSIKSIVDVELERSAYAMIDFTKLFSVGIKKQMHA